MSEISELGGHGVTATIKYGKGYEEPWLVFRGTPEEVKADILKTFGYPDGGKLNLSELVLNVAGQANAMELARVQLGAVAITAEQAESTDLRDGGQEGQDDPWADAEKDAREKAAQPPAEEPAEDPLKVHYDTIASIDDVSKLKRYWAENQGVFSNADLMTAYKARGKALSK